MHPVKIVLCEDHAIIKSINGTSPFQLVYGKYVILPIELKLLSLFLIMEAEELTSSNLPQRVLPFLDLGAIFNDILGIFLPFLAIFPHLNLQSPYYNTIPSDKEEIFSLTCYYAIF